MYTLLLAVHVLVSFALIIIVLLQMGKGASIGASFGAGAAGTQFGPTGGGGSAIGKITAAAAVIFMLTSLSLAIMQKSNAGGSLPSQSGAPTAPVTPEKAE